MFSKSINLRKQKTALVSLLSKVPASLKPDSMGKEKESKQLKLSDMAFFSKKQSLRNSLKSQIEFYLGDPNLRNDKSMQKVVTENKKGYVPVEIFLNFNRVKALFFKSNISNFDERKRELVEAIGSSKILKLNKKKDGVKRRIAFDFKSLETEGFWDVLDKRIVYVEGLDPSIGHDEVYGLFCRFGSILHISLPRGEGGVNKGFAFVEFEVRFFLNFFRRKNQLRGLWLWRLNRMG